MVGAKHKNTTAVHDAAAAAIPVITHDHAFKGGPPAAPANHEAALTGVMALAYLFSNCVEAFGLVHPSFRFEKQEQVLIAALGIQQARLLIWGDCVGVTSPPPTVTDRAVPKHPSAAYPDLKEPTFFNARDARLDEPDTRQQIDKALSIIVDRSTHSSREEMMELYGLRPPKKFTAEYQAPLDINRLEAFRERFELLKEVAESYAHISTRRNESITATPWGIADLDKFANFIKLSTEQVDFIIDLMEVRERVDRAVRMDIRGMGWHLTADRQRIALDTSKLKLIEEACKDQYPQYIEAVQEALGHIDRDRRENAADYNPYRATSVASASATPGSHPHGAFSARPSGRGSIAAPSGVTNGATNGDDTSKQQKKHGGLFGGLFKRKSSTQIPHQGRSASVGAPSSAPHRPEPPRSMSDVGQFPSSGEALSPQTTQPTQPPQPEGPVDEDNNPLPGTIRSKSVGDILDAPINTHEEEETRLKLEQMRTNATDATMEDDVRPPSRSVEAIDEDMTPQPREKGHSDGLGANISIHDQYHGLGRQGTKTQW